MAQTKRKRQTKHRGNAAGAVVNRGRTGRKPEPVAKKPADRKEAAAQRRAERYDRPPSWRAAFQRALIAAVIFGVLVLVLFDNPVSAAVPLAVFMVAVYTPLGYYTDSAIYRRRQRKQLLARAEAREARKRS